MGLFPPNAQRAADEQRRGLTFAGTKQKSAGYGGRMKAAVEDDARHLGLLDQQDPEE